MAHLSLYLIFDVKTDTKIIILSYFLCGIVANVSVVIKQCIATLIPSVADACEVKMNGWMLTLR